jgi:CHAT domain-containing protein/tetratricopeptide (TPR) repeat protein
LPIHGILWLGTFLFLVSSPSAQEPAGNAGSPDSGYPPTPAGVDSIVARIDAARYAEAESLGWVLIREFEAEEGPDSYEVARTCDAMVGALTRMRSQEALQVADSLATRAIEIKTVRLGPEHPEVARSLGGRSSVLAGQGRLEEAVNVRLESVAILRRDPGPDPTTLASALAHTGIYYGMQGLYEEATPYLVEAYEVYTEALGPDHLDTGAAAHGVGNIYYVRGEYAEARKYYQQSLSSLEANADPTHPRIMVALYSLGNVARIQGDYVGARAYFLRGLELGEERGGPDSYELVRNLRGLGNVEVFLGNPEEALALRLRALRVAEANLDPDSFDLLAEVENVGISLRMMGRPEEARPYLTRAIRIASARSPTHDQLVEPLAELARVELAAGNQPAAVDTLTRALAIAEEVLGPANHLTGDVQGYLALAYEEMGEYAAAGLHLDAAIAAYESGWRDRQNYARLLLQRSRVRLAIGEYDAAFADARQGDENGREHFVATLRSLSEGAGLRFATFRGNGVPLMLSALLLMEAPPDSSILQAWDALIRARGLLQEEMLVRNRLVRDTESGELVELSRAVLDARTRLATLYLQGPGGEDLEHFTGRLEVAVREKEAAEDAFAARSGGFREEAEALEAGMEEVQGAVPEGGALVAYVRYPRRRPGEDPTNAYVAFVLRGGGEAPGLVDLGDAENIEERVAAWRAAVGDSRIPSGPLAEASEERVREAGSALRAAMLDSLAPHLGDADPVLIVPDGSLHLVNPAALPAEPGVYLVEEGPLFPMLPSERSLLIGSDDEPSGGGLLALGGPAFGDPAAVRTEQPDLLALGRPNTPQRGVGPDCDQFLELAFPPLPGAVRESREIAALWNRTREGNAVVLTGDEATEAAFKQQSGGRSVLHLATHGYFLRSECALGRDAGADSASAAALFDVVRGNPLLLSGLALAGSNERKGTDAGNDGVLTAEEIATQDLQGVEWVVLSACDTGRGEVLEGEGVYGLQRAFQGAGARTVIMSLWGVDDQATREWMTTLYQARWQAGAGTAEAVRAASRTMLGDLRARGLSTSPVTWGAFVAAGDWR